MRVLLGVAAFSLLIAAPAFAEDQTTTTTTTTAPAPEAPTSDRSRIICKTMPTATGTRLGAAKECHTLGEWEDRRQADREQLNNAQHDRRGGDN